MDREGAEAFARTWIAAWNRRDAEAVLAFYEDGVTFTSPTALEVVGKATVMGKDALRAYWQKALGTHTTLHFTLSRVIWDPQSSELAIVYTSVANGRAKRVVEIFQFVQGGQVSTTEVLHGIVPT